MVGDMCGFAAATFSRGINFFQVNSSVGGKTGINHPLGKNLIRAFYHPQCTKDTLNLSDRDLASGIAEVVKY
ncbi:hypothetical protein EJB05_40810, partial [Eragrostis curvula]